MSDNVFVTITVETMPNKEGVSTVAKWHVSGRWLQSHDARLVGENVISLVREAVKNYDSE